MYAIIKFTDEDKSRIVSVDDIKNFNITNFQKNKKYLVKYEDGTYYPAQVLIYKETIEELEEYKEKKRLNFINKDLLESATECDSDSGDVNLNKRKKDTSLKQKIENQKKKTEGKILNNLFNQKEAEKQPKSPIDKQKEIEKVSGQREEFEIEKSKLLKKIDDLEMQNKELFLLNIQLQKAVIDHFSKLEISKTESKTINQDIGEPKIGGIINNQIHLGRGVMVSREAYNDAWFMSTSGAQFVKSIAVAIFGTQTLMNSSVTGRTSNNYKKQIKKPALDATKLAAIEDIYKYYLENKAQTSDIKNEIKNIKSYVASKISDLMRSNRKKEKLDAQKELDEQNEPEEEYNEEPEVEPEKEDAAAVTTLIDDTTDV